MALQQPSGRPGPAVEFFLLRGAVLLAALSMAAGGCAHAARPVSAGAPPILPSAPGPAIDASATYWYEPFNTVDPQMWKEGPVKGKSSTLYSVTTLDNRSCLRAVSQDSASILLAPMQFSPETYEWLTWDWRVDQFVDGEALERKDGSDAPARIYVYFETMGLPWQKRSLDYVWSKTLPKDTLMDSAFSSASRILVIESGQETAGQWRTEQRSLRQDFERAFGPQQRVPNVVGIGVMTDADNSKGSAVAYFDNLRVSRYRPKAGGG